MLRLQFLRASIAIKRRAVAKEKVYRDPERARVLGPDLAVLKISYPRRDPQGGMIERDLHGGQQYIRIVDLELS